MQLVYRCNQPRRNDAATLSAREPKVSTTGSDEFAAHASCRESEPAIDRRQARIPEDRAAKCALTVDKRPRENEGRGIDWEGATLEAAARSSRESLCRPSGWASMWEWSIERQGELAGGVDVAIANATRRHHQAERRRDQRNEAVERSPSPGNTTTRHTGRGPIIKAAHNEPAVSKRAETLGAPVSTEDKWIWKEDCIIRIWFGNAKGRSREAKSRWQNEKHEEFGFQNVQTQRPASPRNINSQSEAFRRNRKSSRARIKAITPEANWSARQAKEHNLNTPEASPKAQIWSRNQRPKIGNIANNEITQR